MEIFVIVVTAVVIYALYAWSGGAGAWPPDDSGWSGGASRSSGADPRLVGRPAR